jgi:hypothetical protein
MLDIDGGIPPVKLLPVWDKFWSFDYNLVHDGISSRKSWIEIVSVATDKDKPTCWA